jgi:hypothetical protein
MPQFPGSYGQQEVPRSLGVSTPPSRSQPGQAQARSLSGRSNVDRAGHFAGRTSIAVTIFLPSWIR